MGKIILLMIKIFLRFKRRESTDKPGSVVGQSFVWRQCHHCSQATYPNPMRAALMGFYLVLLRVGFSLPFLLPRMRCALTAPFHPYPTFVRKQKVGRYIFCGTFRRLTPPRHYLALCPMEPGLSSHCKNNARLSGQLPKSRISSYIGKIKESMESNLLESLLKGKFKEISKELWNELKKSSTQLRLNYAGI